MSTTLACHPSIESGIEPGSVALGIERHDSMDLLEHEPLWVYDFENPSGTWLQLTAVRSGQVGRDACLVHPEDVCRLVGRTDPSSDWDKAVPVCKVSLESAKPLYPQSWAVHWSLPDPEGSVETGPAQGPGLAERCIVCLDVSSSMEGDKIELAKMAVFTVLDLKSQAGWGEEVGLATFGDETPGNVSSRFEATSQFASPSTVVTIEQLQAFDGTPLQEGLDEAFRQVPGGDLPYRRILLVTDGWGNVDLDARRAAELAVSHGAVVDCVGIGEGCNQPTLENLALQSGGRYREVQRSRDLVQHMESLAFYPRGAGRLPVEQGSGLVAAQTRENAIESEVVERINQERTARGLPTLQVDENLRMMARDASLQRIRDPIRGKIEENRDPTALLREAGFERAHMAGMIVWSQGLANPADSAVRAALDEPFGEDVMSERVAMIGVGIVRALDGTVMTSLLLTSLEEEHAVADSESSEAS